MAYFYAILCLKCHTVHGWIDHPLVKKVTKGYRGSMEDVWWCPGCNREHRTWDGSMMGQYQKLWKEINSEAELCLQNQESVLMRRVQFEDETWDWEMTY